MPTGIYRHKQNQGFQRGHKVPIKWKEIIIKSHKGIKQSPEHIAKRIKNNSGLFIKGHKTNIGRIGWNKGLTKETDDRVLQYSNSHKGFISHRKNKSILQEYPRERALEIVRKIKQARAKQITPVKDTSIEIKIQNFLKQLGIDFFTHQYMKITHGYQCDILIPSMNMVIECDGDYWHKYPVGTEIDNIRTRELLEKGFKVLRLWEFEINKLTLDEFKEKLNGR